MANKIEEVIVMAKVDDITTLTIETKMVTKIILKEGATLLDLKTSHTYNVSYVKGMDTTSHTNIF